MNNKFNKEETGGMSQKRDREEVEDVVKDGGRCGENVVKLRGCLCSKILDALTKTVLNTSSCNHQQINRLMEGG